MNLSPEELRNIEGRWKSDVDLKLDRADIRLRVIERLVWIASGGVIVLGAVSMIGVSILISFSQRLERVSNSQAVGIAEQRINHDNVMRRTDGMQAEIDRLRQRVR